MSLTARLKKLFAKAYRTIPAAQAQELIQQRRAVLLDVRERHEWNAGHGMRAWTAAGLPTTTRGGARIR